MLFDKQHKIAQAISYSIEGRFFKYIKKYFAIQVRKGNYQLMFGDNKNMMFMSKNGTIMAVLLKKGKEVLLTYLSAEFQAAREAVHAEKEDGVTIGDISWEA